jgi:hypothetical protein
MMASALERAVINSGEWDMTLDDTGLAKAGGRGI